MSGRRIRRGLSRAVVAAALLAGAVGCGGDGDDPAKAAREQSVAPERLCGGAAVSAGAGKALKAITGSSRFEASAEKSTVAHAAEEVVGIVSGRIPEPVGNKGDVCRIYTPVGTPGYELRVTWRLSNEATGGGHQATLGVYSAGDRRVGGCRPRRGLCPVHLPEPEAAWIRAEPCVRRDGCRADGDAEGARGGRRGAEEGLRDRGALRVAGHGEATGLRGGRGTRGAAVTGPRVTLGAQGAAAHAPWGRPPLVFPLEAVTGIEALCDSLCRRVPQSLGHTAVCARRTIKSSWSAARRHGGAPESSPWTGPVSWSSP